jgi:hypothetical protein
VYDCAPGWFERDLEEVRFSTGVLGIEKPRLIGVSDLGAGRSRDDRL